MTLETVGKGKTELVTGDVVGDADREVDEAIVAVAALTGENCAGNGDSFF